MFYEPARTQYDLDFQFLGIPIRVHPLFWILTLFLGMNLSGPQMLILWILAVFISILVHELGHALVMRTYGLQPRIVLYSFGGLTIFDRRYHLRWFENVLVSFAGPGAGFCFLAVLTGLFCLLGQTQILNIFPAAFGIEPAGSGFVLSESLTILLCFLIQVNIFWGILNLMPIFPLDGGQIVREFLMYRSPAIGLPLSLKISIGTAGAWAFFFFTHGMFFNGLLFVWMLYSNYQILQQLTTRRSW